MATDIEGSEERAAERGRIMDHAGMAVGAGEALGDPQVAAMLVRGFLVEVVEARTAFLGGKKTGEESAAAVNAASEKMAAVFLGDEPAYIGNLWFTEAGLGEAMARASEGKLHPREAVTAFFLGIAAQSLDLGARVENDAVTEDAAKFQSEAIIENAVAALLGLPVVSQFEIQRG